MFERIVFATIATGIIAILIAMTYQTRSKLFAIVLVAVLCVFIAFYLFQFGTLGSFTMKALSTEVGFIKEKKEEARAGVAEINELRHQTQEHANAIEGVAARLHDTEKEIEDSKNRILAMEKDVREARELAQPVELHFAQIVTEQSEKGLTSFVVFRATKNEALGRLTFSVALPKGGSARVISFVPSLKGGAFSSGDQTNNVAPDGLTAELTYVPMAPEHAVLELITSGETPIRIEGNKLAKPCEIKVAKAH
jgi:hypothetical protein